MSYLKNNDFPIKELWIYHSIKAVLVTKEL